MGLLRRLLDSRAMLRLAEIFDRRSENRVTEFGMLAQAFEFTKINGVRGDYFEFGVFRGKTFGYARTMARRYRVSDIVFRGFDSFEGLPQVDADVKYEGWSEGQYACSKPEFEAILRRKGFDRREYALVEGFYDRSLTDALAATLSAEGVLARLVYVDCDLYESTRDVLLFVRHFLQDGTIVCFDDYWHYRGRSDQGEQRAITEFLAANPAIRLRPWVTYSPMGQSFICELDV